MPSLTLCRSALSQNDGTPVVNNHLQFVFLHEPPSGHPPAGEPRLVEFKVEAFSVKHAYDGDWNAGGAAFAPMIPSMPTSQPPMRLHRMLTAGLGAFSDRGCNCNSSRSLCKRILCAGADWYAR